MHLLYLGSQGATIVSAIAGKTALTSMRYFQIFSHVVPKSQALFHCHPRQPAHAAVPDSDMQMRPQLQCLQCAQCQISASSRFSESEHTRNLPTTSRLWCHTCSCTACTPQNGGSGMGS